MELNKQGILKQMLTSQSLKVHSIFKTIQGEGIFAGEPAIFVRLFGCNLECPLCDTDYTSRFDSLGVTDLLKLIENYTMPNKLVVITGGEPFRQNIAPIVNELISKEYRVQLETNGTLFVPGMPYDDPGLTIMCSPKTGKVNKNLEPYIDAYKYILHADAVALDGLPLSALNHSVKEQVARPQRLETPIFLQPVDVQDEEENNRHLKATIDICMYRGYRFSLQIHKIVDMP